MGAAAAREAPGAVAAADDVLASHFTLADRPGELDRFAPHGAIGYIGADPHPALALARWTTTERVRAAAVLGEALSRCAADGRPLDWMTGPACAAAGLPRLLDARGFGPSRAVAAMVMAIPPGFRAAAAPGAHVRRAAADDAAAWRVMARGFDVPEPVGAILHRAYLTPSARQRTAVFLASNAPGAAATAVGYLSYLGEGPAVLMRVSATLPDARGRGLYRALIERRLEEAARRGRRLAYVQAYSDESRRALAGLGFEAVGTLRLRRWHP